MVDETSLVLNMSAQGLRPIADGIAWFESLTSDQRHDALSRLAMFCTQAGATSENATEAIRRAGIRPTHTPAVLLQRGRMEVQLAKIVNLPEDERLRSFRLLVALLGVSDGRRRARLCSDGCGHAWHHLGAPAEPSIRLITRRDEQPDGP
ncbi:hypothetical protein BJY14_004228 [Actinomadura luteofluorescens]|uniref:Uncharacterized protein n=1 Tax=Actinomadura luteofluorescens TaxID=46163 RepID=A0A7Y9EJ95_9ACTN|nr:DUF5958 family protein [Actinomadura luteofluorescens]NYD48245.1 hypothetical protein [Actinomadura luteofluorescens]